MLSKKRPILFEVMGHKVRASRPLRAYDTPIPTGRNTPVHRREAPAPKPKPKAAARPKRTPAMLMQSPSVRWAALAGMVLVAVVLAVWRLQRPSDSAPPRLQSNVQDAAPAAPAPVEPPAPPASSSAFAVCVMEKPYKTPAERKLAAERVQEIVNFLGYDSDPAFRDDVRAKDCPGKESGTGAFRIYVGSAGRKSELIPLRDKLVLTSWKKTRPFQNASIRVVER